MMDVPQKTGLADQLLIGIDQNSVPPCPAILQRVVNESQKPEPDLRQLATIVSGDVGIAASLLKTVNSPFYGLPGKAHTVQQAISLLGIRPTVNAVASLALQQVLPPPPKLERFWDGSMKIARLSGWLAQKLGPAIETSADLAYTFALFRDAGIPLMLNRYPDYYTTLEEANNCPERLFTQIEEDRHATSHALVGYLLAQSWWLSPNTCTAVRYHHDISMMSSHTWVLSKEAGELIALAQLAEHLLQHLTGQSQTREWCKMGTDILARLQLTDSAVQDLLEEARSLSLIDS